MIGDKEHICRREEDIRKAIKLGVKRIYAYTDIEIKEKTARKIQKEQIIIYGVKREEK